MTSTSSPNGIDRDFRSAAEVDRWAVATADMFLAYLRDGDRARR